MELEKDKIGNNKSARNILESFTMLPKRKTTINQESSVIKTFI